MSIKGKTQELFVQKQGVLIRDLFYNKKTIPYEKISKIEYCYPSGIEGGWMDFIEYNEKKTRFCFSRKSRKSIDKAISYFYENAQNISLIEKSPQSYRFYYHKWFIILITFIFCAPIGLILLWCSPLQRKAFKIGVTSIWIAIFAYGIISWYIAFDNLMDSFYSIFDTSTYISEETEPETGMILSESVQEEGSEVYTDTLAAGHYTVGIDIPSGTYNFYAKSGYGNILSESGAVNEIFDSGTAVSEAVPGLATSEISNVELSDGDILTVSGTLEVSAGCDDAGEVVPREQELEEIELGYGIYSAGDDFTPGTYDIEWIEGNGNIQTDPYESNYGINEIFGAKLGEEGSVTDEINKAVYGDDTDSYIEYNGEYDALNDMMYIKRFENATFSEGDLLKIEDIKVKLVPSN